MCKHIPEGPQKDRFLPAERGRDLGRLLEEFLWRVDEDGGCRESLKLYHLEGTL